MNCGADEEPVNVEELLMKSVIDFDKDGIFNIVGNVTPFTNGLGTTGYQFNQASDLPGCEESPSSYMTIDSIGPIWNDGFSVVAIVEFSENRYFERIIDFGNGPGEQEGFNVTLSRLQESNSLAFTSWINSDSLLNRTRGRVVAADVIENGQPMFIAGTISENGVMAIYVDGVRINRKSNGHPVINIPRTSNFIGRSNWCDEDPDFKGRIETLMIFNKDLSSNEVTALYDYLKSLSAI
ncbi:LamG domain-containing protein [Fulvivirga sedimenti]|uniref:LamG domain-containing protein n=1 Tax=Fulvivirga sedimenti TaxID=2879465 RepID=A0A9X1HPX7_9BACT|nr:LamG domain-containing protein [Fulvivirga sedimenti]MCA6074603.1 LamG domain-containing protein [Fulvivirga sedimenti]MCA6075780.1 LamG domain-containing protein [Fulvivirga sedimenti]MCA6076908.1 LamG domain-containing protein [Fulvivirga sedimenti]